MFHDEIGKYQFQVGYSRDPSIWVNGQTQKMFPEGYTLLSVNLICMHFQT
jgi:hypothetical protein